jgi:rRNA maturation endonuclease Nob1
MSYCFLPLTEAGNLFTVTEFSKKTGDYPSLSATDLQVLALTYQLEAEFVGVSHLKQEPEKVNQEGWVFVCFNKLFIVRSIRYMNVEGMLV